MAAKKVSGKEILSLLQEGYVRYKKDKVEGSIGSVEEKLELNASELRTFLKHPKLANFRYKPVVALLDDFEDENELVDDFDNETAINDAENLISETEKIEEEVFA